MTNVALPHAVATTVTASATLAKGKHTPVDATAAARTMTLPTDAAAGVEISVEKTDTSANAVTVSGTLRGTAGSTITLTSQFEARTFLSEGSGSWRPTSDHRTAASLSASYAAVITPEAFKAVGDGVADDTAAVQAAFNAVPATGGWVLLRKKYKVTASVTIPTRCKVTGLGGFDASFAFHSGIVCATDGVDALIVNANGCTLEDFVINYAGGTRPTSGSGLRVASGDFARISRLSISGFWNNLQHDTGWYYTIDSCQIYDSVNYGIYLRNTESGGADHGDQGIVNCVISKVRDTNNGGTAVRWESGGGLRFIGNKINAATQVGYAGIGRWDYGLVLACDDNVGTGVFPITGNSIENALQACIRITTKNATPVSTSVVKVQIVGNEISPFGATAHGIVIDPGAVWQFTDYVISGNSIVVASGNRCIWVKNLGDWKVSGNQMRGDYHVFVDVGCTGYDIDAHAANGNGSLVYNSQGDNAAWYSRPVSDTRGIASMAASTSTPLWNVKMGAMSSGCMVEVSIVGRLIGTGGGPVARTKRFYILGNGGAAATVGTMLTDDKSGASTLDVTTTIATDVVTLAAIHTDAGLTFRGQIALRVTGPIFQVTCR